jgi:23S rRNA (guanosine2251-2'-O)-methyltransferase
MSRESIREVLYGRQAVREVLTAGRRRPFRLLLAARLDPALIVDEIAAAARQQHVPITTVSREELARLAQTEEHQGVALEASPYPYATSEAMLAAARDRGEAAWLLLLDLIQDVHNLGSLLRTAEAVGVHGVLLQERRAAGITPAAVNTASGATEHLRIAQVTNLAREMASLQEAGIWFAGLEGSAAQSYTTLDMTVPLGLVVGSEGGGLRRLVRERCDWLIALPMRGQVASLNAAAAGSVTLYEGLRQRTAKIPRH